MKINKKILEKISACHDGINWFINKYGDGDNDVDFEILANDLLKDGKESWLSWFITRNLNKTDLIKYAIFSAELVLHIFEKTYPDDNRPRKAIEAAKEYLKDNSIEYAVAIAADATDAADAAADAVYASDAAIYAATAAAADAAIAADAAVAIAADANTNAANAAAYAAAYAAYAAHAYTVDADDIIKETYKKIIDFGIQLLNEEQK